MTDICLPFDYSIPPTPLPPPPRRVHGIFAYMRDLWIGRLFSMVFIPFGVGMIGYWILLWLWLFYGWDVPGKVIGSQIAHGGRGGTRYELRYQYQIEAHAQIESESVTHEIYNRFSDLENIRHLQNDVTVHYFSLDPFHHAQLSDTDFPSFGQGFLTLWVAGFGCMSVKLIYQLWFKPFRISGLYKHGLVTTGTIIGTWAGRGKSPTYYAAYKFDDPATGQPIQSEMQIWSKAQWATAATDRAVTVLYDPRKPRRNTVYELGCYTIEFAGEATA